MNQSINTDSMNSKEPQQKYRLGTVSIKILGGLNRFYRRLTSPSASIMAETDWNGSSFAKVESLDTIEPIATSILCQFMTIKTFSK